jgi:hypothetical protein
MKLRFFIFNFGGALAIRLQDPFVQVDERAQQIGVSCELQMKRPAAKEAGATRS